MYEHFELIIGFFCGFSIFTLIFVVVSMFCAKYDYTEYDVVEEDDEKQILQCAHCGGEITVYKDTRLPRFCPGCGREFDF